MASDHLRRHCFKAARKKWLSGNLLACGAHILTVRVCSTPGKVAELENGKIKPIRAKMIAAGMHLHGISELQWCMCEIQISN
jgi:hypothetical protein